MWVVFGLFCTEPNAWLNCDVRHVMTLTFDLEYPHRNGWVLEVSFVEVKNDSRVVDLQHVRAFCS